MAAVDEAQRLFCEFLRTRRAHVTPESVGLPRVGHPRRVRGLRREEVAQLASVSADYYTRLEQGRLPAPSAAVLTAIARALRLDDDQERYLRAIADRSRRQVGLQRVQPQAVAPELRMVLEGLDRLPAMVIGRHLDLLAWNSMSTSLFIDFAEVPEADRNIVRLIYLDDRVRSRFKDWPSAARSAALLLRMSTAFEADDPRRAQLVEELSQREPHFRKWWDSQRVASNSHGRRTYVHPAVGEFELGWQMLSSSAHIDQRIMVFTPEPGTSGAEALNRLANARPS